MPSISQLVRGLLPPRNGQPVMIVGMHRSGTSYLTGSLQAAGLELVSFSAWNPHNTKGNRENQAIVDFHEKMLAARGCAWDIPPAGNVAWTEDEHREARDLIDTFRGHAVWGFKDPRALLFVEGWRELLPKLRFVGVFRHPDAVFRSLTARGHQMTPGQVYALWACYNQRLLALHRITEFPLLCFDDSEAVLHDKLNRVLRALKLRELGNERFFSSELRHHASAEGALPAPIEAMYQSLKDLAL